MVTSKAPGLAKAPGRVTGILARPLVATKAGRRRPRAVGRNAVLERFAKTGCTSKGRIWAMDLASVWKRFEMAQSIAEYEEQRREA